MPDVMNKLNSVDHTLGALFRWEMAADFDHFSAHPHEGVYPDFRSTAAPEEIRGITWDLEGPELDPWQAAQRLWKSGFREPKELATFWAVLEAESGGYLRAWHHNVVRNSDGSIFRTNDGLMEVKSTDLGFIQKNVVHNPRVQLSVTGGESKAFVADLFDAFPELANGQESADIAREMFEQRGYQPWYAHSNGSYKKSLDRGCLAVGNFLGMALVGNSNLLQRRV